MGTRLWLHQIGSNEGLSLATFAPLERSGFLLVSLDEDAPSGFGVLVVTRPIRNLSQLVSEWSCCGIHRVLVIATDRTVIADDDAWMLLDAGAADVLIWTDVPDPVALIAERLERWRVIEDLLASPAIRDNLVGKSQPWITVLRQVIEVAHFTSAPVLLLGETGTGKEQVARLIHSLDLQRRDREMVVVDCTTIVPELAGSEFFGHERGSFTGAIASREGAFAVGNGGTLFLDEVGELPLALQPQLLRVVQEGTYKRVGSNTWHRTDFRLICATNRNLGDEGPSPQFRNDLYYRIAGWVCRLPPLRERIEDVVLLANHFMQQMRPGQDPVELSQPVREYLLTRPYPGNVRDLRQLVARIMYRHIGSGPVTIGDVPEEERMRFRPSPDSLCEVCFDGTVRRALALGAGLRDIRRIAEESAIRVVTTDEQGNLQRAAKRLGVTDRALQQRRAARRLPAEGLKILQAI